MPSPPKEPTNLIDLREARGVSVDDLATEMAVSEYVIWDLERDAASHGIETLHRYLNRLGFRLELTAVDASGKRTVIR